MQEMNAHDHDVPSLNWQRDGCFGCGPSNPNGLQLKFTLGLDGQSYISEFQLGSSFVGPPGHAHGGIIATILDEAMGKANKLKSTVALTRRMEVEYFRPVPLGVPLVAEGRIERIDGRSLHNSGEIRNSEGVILARSRGTFVTIDPNKMFGRELERERNQPL
jgi:uncharacterized protein (TIGR00369 family)